MARLHIEQPGNPPITMPVSGGELRLGRADDNDVVLVADEVSRHHARLRLHNGDYLLIDQNSLNGTYVNRQRIVQRVLSHNDEVWLGGQCRIIFQDEEEASRRSRRDTETDSTLREDLERIRARIDEAGNHLSLIGTGREKPASPQETADLEAMGQAYRRLAALYEASKLIASEFDLPKRLAAVLDTAIGVMRADRGFLMLQDEQSGGLHVRVAREMGRDLQASSPSMSIAGKAATAGEPVLMADASGDHEFAGRESIVQQQITSAMAVPLRVDDRVLGSIYVDTRRLGQQFSEADLELFATLATQLAMAIENVRLYEEAVANEKKRANLGRFLSPAIVESVMQTEDALRLGGEKRMVSTLFCDVRGFTSIAERLAPTTLVEMLNEHFTAMTTLIFREQGTLDKFIGDEIMAVFGAPLSAGDDPLRAVRAALAIADENSQLNQRRAQAGQPCFDVGIGIATGEVIAGYVGAPERMEFTVVGDRVNTARRLCSLAGGGQVVIDEDTYNAVRHHADVRAIGACVLKGKEKAVHAFEVTRLRASATPSADARGPASDPS